MKKRKERTEGAKVMNLCLNSCRGKTTKKKQKPESFLRAAVLLPVSLRNVPLRRPEELGQERQQQEEQQEERERAVNGEQQQQQQRRRQQQREASARAAPREERRRRHLLPLAALAALPSAPSPKQPNAAAAA